MPEIIATLLSKSASNSLHSPSFSKLNELRSSKSDRDHLLCSKIRNLFTFTGLAVDHARELAKCGQKDEARYWHRIVVNSGIVEILRQCDFYVFDLEERVNLLGLECHPLHEASFTNDLAAIKYTLDEILSKVSKTTETETESSGGPSRINRRRSKSASSVRKNVIGFQALKANRNKS